MRLFSRSDEKKKRLSEEESMLARKSMLSKTIAEQERRASLITETIEPEKVRLEREFADFVSQTNAKKSKLSGEVAELEARRTAALLPVDAMVNSLTAELHEKFNQVAAREQSIRQQKSELEAERQSLVGRKEYIEEQFDALKARIEDITLRDAKSKLQAEHASESLQAANNRWDEYRKAVERQNQELSAWQETLRLREAAIAAQQQGIQEGRKYAEEIKLRLLDERSMLDRDWQELKTKQHGGSETR